MKGEVRPFAEEHIPDIATLYVKVMQGGGGSAGKALQNYFHDIFFENPWVSPELPSLVYWDRGKLVGFLGVIPRFMEFRGRTIRVAVCSQFMVDREEHRGFGGVELMRLFLRGPQDLSYTDGAGEASHIVWTAAGGQASSLYSFNWLRVLRPLKTVRSFIDRTQGAMRLAGGALLAGAAPVDLVLSKLPHAAFRPPASAHTSKQVTTDELFQCIQELGWREPLQPKYEPTSFRWLITQAAASRPGEDLRMATVHAPDGLVCGWYVYYAKRGGPADVLQIGVRRRDHFDPVLLALFRDAWQQGSSFVRGQAIPQFLVNLTNQNCLFRHPNTSVLFQSRDPDLVDTIYRGKTALSRLDGECWMRFGTAAGIV